MNMAHRAGRLIAIAALAATPITASAQETTLLGTNLFGSDVPDGGADKEAFADFNGEIDPAQARLCYYFEMEGLDGAQAAHIHRGRKGQNGEVVVTLAVPSEAAEEICLDLDAAVLQSMAQNPADYYVDIHSEGHPDGALRGQFGR